MSLNIKKFRKNVWINCFDEADIFFIFASVFSKNCTISSMTHKSIHSVNRLTDGRNNFNFFVVRMRAIIDKGHGTSSISIFLLNYIIDQKSCLLPSYFSPVFSRTRTTKIKNQLNHEARTRNQPM